MRKTLYEDNKLHVDGECGDDVKQALYDKLLDFYVRHESFSGESVAQTDGLLLEAPELMEDIAEDIFKFKSEWKSD